MVCCPKEKGILVIFASTYIKNNIYYPTRIITRWKFWYSLNHE